MYLRTLFGSYRLTYQIEHPRLHFFSRQFLKNSFLDKVLKYKSESYREEKNNFQLLTVNLILYFNCAVFMYMTFNFSKKKKTLTRPGLMTSN